MNNEQLKKLHKEKNTKGINENLYKANIKLVDMNRYLKIDIKNLKQEIERLNNIINELEKYFIEETKDYDKHINSQYITDISREQYEGEKVCFEDALGKLHELKGSDKE